MKRQEMVGFITEILEQYLEEPEELSDILLTMLEEMGMLPPCKEEICVPNYKQEMLQGITFTLNAFTWEEE